MLVLSRKKSESILIGKGEDLIEIVVVEIRGDKVRLGLRARPEIPIHRSEVWSSINEGSQQLRQERISRLRTET